MNRYPDHSDVKTYLNVQTNRDDALIVALVQRAIAIFENLARRSFVPAVEVKYFSATGSEVIDWHTIWLRDCDLLSVSELMVGGVVVPSEEYILEGGPPHYKITLLSDSDFSFSFYATNPQQHIKITGTWGYSANIVPDDVFGAIVRLTAYLYAQKDNAMELDRTNAVAGGMVIPNAIPNDVQLVANFYKRMVA